MSTLLAFDTSTCTVIRVGRMSHQCVMPGTHATERLGLGAVVVCTCGRRYKCRRLGPDSPLGWDRRFLPWPRAPKNGQDGAPA